jgi:hypothetical protein
MSEIMKIQNLPKKRGRKPKGGKIVKNEPMDKNINVEKKNIILHLKCKLSDIQTNSFHDITSYNPTLCVVEPFSEDNTYETIVDTEPADEKKDIKCDKHKKSIYNKLGDLEKMLNTNNIHKKSACFWDTCEFDSPSIHIPMIRHKDKYEVYGCFCSPECAASYLFNEHLDDNTKFERYQLLNNMYGKIYNYEKNIKLAPNPYYLISKFYGNLDIQEYRQLLTFERLLLIMDKPLTKIYPELHEDNNEFETMYDHKIGIKKTTKVEKSKIIKGVFGN